MDFSSSNTTPPLTSQQSSQNDTPDPNSHATFHDFKRAQHNRRPATFKGGSESAKAAMSGAIAEGIAQEQAAQQGAQPASEGGGLNWTDPWDEPNAVNTEGDADEFSRFRTARTMPLEAPLYTSLDEGALSDFGRAMVVERIPQGMAQEIVNAFAAAEKSERGEYDAERTVDSLYAEWGVDATHETLGAVAKFCEKRPALAAYLNSTGVGNSLAAVRLLAGAATVGTTPAEARAFIEKVNSDASHPYWHDVPGHALAVDLMRWAMMVAGDAR